MNSVQHLETSKVLDVLYGIGKVSQWTNRNRKNRVYMYVIKKVMCWQILIRCKAVFDSPWYTGATGGGRKGIRPKLLLCASKSPTYLGRTCSCAPQLVTLQGCSRCCQPWVISWMSLFVASTTIVTLTFMDF